MRSLMFLCLGYLAEAFDSRLVRLNWLLSLSLLTSLSMCAFPIFSTFILFFFFYSVSFYPIPLWVAARLPDVPPPVSNVQNSCLCCPPIPTTFLWLDATFDSISLFFVLLIPLCLFICSPLRCGFKCVILE